MSVTALLVGAYFRPPAKQICQILPSGTQVELRKELDNPYDSDAVSVWLKTKILEIHLVNASLRGREEFVDALAGCGWTVDQLLTAGDVQLGYLAREGNRDLTRRAASCGPLVSAKQVGQMFEGASALGAKFVWGPSGEWLIKVEDHL